VEIAPLGKRLMPLFRDPLLAVWEAMNLLSQVEGYPDAPQIKTLIMDAERLLCRLTIELSRRQKLQYQYASQDNKIVPINRRFTLAFEREK
jgi:hypothetical protein